jgi:hypothetical protein
MANRNKLAVLALMSAGAAAFFVFAASQLESFNQAYFETEYSSGGAFVRILMGFIPATLLLVRWGRVDSPYRIRMVWLGMALANVAALGALAISPSSTVIDRLALYFTAVQIYAFGEIHRLIGLALRNILVTRMLVIAISALVMLIWLNFATHASDWVPYETFWQRS